MILLIKIAAITMLFVVSEPMILLKRFIGFKDENYMLFSKTKAFIHRLINCCLCSGFYIGLIITGSLYDAALIAVISELIYKINNRL
jgi:hypothetical protein